jgi:hypothetical protein
VIQTFHFFARYEDFPAPQKVLHAFIRAGTPAGIPASVLQTSNFFAPCANIWPPFPSLFVLSRFRDSFRSRLSISALVRAIRRSRIA